MTRLKFQALAGVRVAEAKLLLDNGMPDGAFYLAGYTVELGLKACIMARVERTGVIFEDRKFSEKCWTHNIEALVELADLRGQRDADAAADPTFGQYWQVAKDWTELSRYQRKTQTNAQDLYDAVTDASHGVLPWIKR